MPDAEGGWHGQGQSPGTGQLGTAHGLGLGGETGGLAMGDCPTGKAPGTSAASRHKEEENKSGRRLRNLLGMTDEHFSSLL